MNNMNFKDLWIKFEKFTTVIKLKKFEPHNYGHKFNNLLNNALFPCVLPRRPLSLSPFVFVFVSVSVSVCLCLCLSLCLSLSLSLSLSLRGSIPTLSFLFLIPASILPSSHSTYPSILSSSLVCFLCLAYSFLALLPSSLFTFLEAFLPRFPTNLQDK